MNASLRARVALRWLLRRLGGAARRSARALARVEAAVGDARVLELEQRRAIAAALRTHDMANAPDEAYYRERYWAWIEPRFPADRSGVFLDAGCGPGRLTIPVARLVAPDGGRVVGVDLLAESVEAARRNAEGLPNVELRQADLLDFLAEQADEAFSGALFFEVAYEVLDLPRTVRELHRVLRLGAPLLASFRTQQYLALFAVRGRDWELADAVVRKRSGHLPAMGWQSWHTSAEAAALLQEAGFAEVELGGIGICSGIAGDPLAAIARPSELGAAELECLALVEEQLARTHPDTGRYLLTAAVRT